MAEPGRVWLDHYLARLEVQRAEACARMLKAAEELRKEMPRQQPFRCVRGAVLDDPFAPGVVELHQPHVMAASRDQR